MPTPRIPSAVIRMPSASSQPRLIPVARINPPRRIDVTSAVIAVPPGDVAKRAQAAARWKSGRWTKPPLCPLIAPRDLQHEQKNTERKQTDPGHGQPLVAHAESGRSQRATENEQNHPAELLDEHDRLVGLHLGHRRPPRLLVIEGACSSVLAGRRRHAAIPSARLSARALPGSSPTVD